jgi:deferrochelatase/peroxidase EfeB
MVCFRKAEEGVVASVSIDEGKTGWQCFFQVKGNTEKEAFHALREMVQNTAHKTRKEIEILQRTEENLQLWLNMTHECEG